MLRFAALLTAAVVFGGGTADAAWHSRHHRHHHHYRGYPAAFVRVLPTRQLYPSRPAWAPEGACFTDDGYGRFLPCGAGRSN